MSAEKVYTRHSTPADVLRAWVEKMVGRRRLGAANGLMSPTKLYLRPEVDAMQDYYAVDVERELEALVVPLEALSDGQVAVVEAWVGRVGRGDYAGTAPRRVTVWRFRPGFDAERITI